MFSFFASRNRGVVSLGIHFGQSFLHFGPVRTQFFMSASNLSSKLKLELILYARTVARLNGVLSRWECVWLRDVFELKHKAKEKPKL